MTRGLGLISKGSQNDKGDVLVALGTWMSSPNLCSMSWRYRSSLTRRASYPAWKKLNVCIHLNPWGTRS